MGANQSSTRPSAARQPTPGEGEDGHRRLARRSSRRSAGARGEKGDAPAPRRKLGRDPRMVRRQLGAEVDAPCDRVSPSVSSPPTRNQPRPRAHRRPCRCGPSRLRAGRRTPGTKPRGAPAGPRRRRVRRRVEAHVAAGGVELAARRRAAVRRAETSTTGRPATGDPVYPLAGLSGRSQVRRATIPAVRATRIGGLQLCCMERRRPCPLASERPFPFSWQLPPRVSLVALPACGDDDSTSAAGGGGSSTTAQAR